MTSVLLIGSRGGGGEEVFVRDLAESPPPGVRFTLALDPHRSVPGGRASGLREVLFNRIVHPLLWPLPGLRAYEVDAGVDLVHVHNAPCWLGLPPGCPVVYSVGGASYAHYLETYLGWSPDRVRARYRRARRIYRPLGIRSEIATPERVDAVVVFSEHAASYLTRLGVPAAKIHVVPPGFDIPRPPEGPPRDDPFTFLLVGRDPQRKGADLAIAAVRKLRRRDMEARLLLVGDPTYPDRTEDGVEGWGPVPRSQVFEEFFARADAVLVPSRAEGFGFAAVEAMGCGLPVVASRRDALPEIVGDAGMLVEAGSVDALEDAMAALVGDRRSAKAMGMAGRARFEARFTRRMAREALGALYQGLLA